MAVADILDALGAQIESQLGTAVTDLQVHSRHLRQTSPPCIDMYPSTEGFMERNTFGTDSAWVYFFDVRARVSDSDIDGQQDLLLAMMDPDTAESLTGAMESGNLGGTVDDVSVINGPTGYTIFTDPGGSDMRLLGAVWRVRVIP